MPNEYINYEQVKAGAGELNECANRMQDIFDSVSGSMNTMTTDENFKGQASTALQAEFQPFKNQFTNYVNAVRRFSALFGGAAEELEANEASLNQQIQQL